MAYDSKNLEAYNTVAERIAEFRSKYPDGSLQPWDADRPYTIEVIKDTPYIIVVAAAYRTADDERPGVGMAYEPVPGNTPFTRGSEMQNAETAAWGRAIVAVLAADTKKGIASAEEVRAQQDHNTAPPAGKTPDVDAYVSWFDAIEERSKAPDAYNQLLALYQEATQAKIPDNVLAAITAAGRKAKAETP